MNFTEYIDKKFIEIEENIKKMEDAIEIKNMVEDLKRQCQ